MRTLLRILVRSLIGLTAFTYLFYGENGQLPTLTGDILSIWWSIIVGNLVGLGVTQFTRFWNRILPWRKYFTGRFVVGLLSHLVIATGIVMGMAFLYLFFFTDLQAGAFIGEHQDSVIKMAILLFLALFVNTIVDFTFYSYNEYAVGQIESVKLEREQMELQFEALKTQLSPHYLFNCLNTISSLVDQNATYAETFIRRLVQTYQYILDSKDKKLISVAEEVDFVKAYQYLLKVRFGDAMKINFDLNEQVMKTLIPPLTLQILIENAVKHNEMSEDDPLEIDIRMDQNEFITVRNDKTEGHHDDTISFKIGLENIQKRYSYFTDKPIRIHDTSNFEVKLPLILAA